LLIWVNNIGLFITFKSIYSLKSILFKKINFRVSPCSKGTIKSSNFYFHLNLEEFVPEDHIARVLNDFIDLVDISNIESTYSEEGCPAYHPRLLLKILLYGYLINIRSSRKIDDMTQTDTAFMYLAAMQEPDFHTICRFRSTHLNTIKEIFSQVVTFCKEMDLIGSSVSIDGTKVKANASSRQSKSSDAIEKEIDKILRESIEIDELEDEIYGDSTPYRIPEKLVDKKYRLEKIKAAKKKLDEEKIKKVNITDLDAKIMKHKDGSKKPSYIGLTHLRFKIKNNRHCCKIYSLYS
jgi:transposase